MQRRTFLKTSLASSALLLSGTPGLQRAARANAPAGRSNGQARNVILLVSDGMSCGTLAITDQFLRWRDQRPSHWVHCLEQGIGRAGLMDMQSANSIVTDSAAAASSWGCGHRVDNGALNVTPDGQEAATLCVKAREGGKATGLVTTAQMTHATPAGFAANVARRNMQFDIATQYLEREIDVLLGGGLEHFAPARREDGRDLHAQCVAAGYAHVNDAAQMKQQAQSAPRMIGTFTTGHLPYELDRLNSEALREQVPSLAEMTQASLSVLNRHRDGFFLMVEGARVDHAAHANDIGGLVYDQIAFDDAVGVALDFAAGDGNTLVIVTTDHGNANPGLSSGDSAGHRNFELLAAMTSTHGAMLSQIRRNNELDTIVAAVRAGAGVQLTDEQATILQRRINNDYAAAYRRMNSLNAILGQLIANHTDIGWVGNTHTSDYVQLWGQGPGDAMIKPFTRNTDLHNIIAQALGLEVVSASRPVWKAAATV